MFRRTTHPVETVFILARLVMLFVLLGLAAALVAVVVPAVRNYLGGGERGARGSRALPPASDQLERLEERLDQLAAEQQHLAEQQQFITKLLQERADRPKDDSSA